MTKLALDKTKDSWENDHYPPTLINLPVAIVGSNSQASLIKYESYQCPHQECSKGCRHNGNDSKLKKQSKRAIQVDFAIFIPQSWKWIKTYLGETFLDFTDLENQALNPFKPCSLNFYETGTLQACYKITTEMIRLIQYILDGAILLH